MTKKQTQIILPEETIIKKIVVLRNEKVMLDLHLAELYGVETRTLKQAVRRNINRFPDDFMFELTDKEINTVVSQNVIPHKKYLGGAKPFAFTETGVAMLSSILNSPRAIEMNIAIMRTFIALRKMALNYDEIMRKLKSMEGKYNKKFKELYTTLEYLLTPQTEKRKMIGFNREEQDIEK